MTAARSLYTEKCSLKNEIWFEPSPVNVSDFSRLLKVAEASSEIKLFFDALE